MVKANSTIVAVFIFLLNSFSAGAAEVFNLDSLTAGGLKKIDIGVPMANAPAESGGARLLATVAGQDEELSGALTSAQWEEIFSSGGAGETKELLSDFAARYVIRGTLQLGAVPPTFTTDVGKIYKVVRYPKWLRNTGGARLCVEGYLRQADNTGELAIESVLPLNAMDEFAPSDATTEVQRHPFVLSKDRGAYALGNVNWGVQHSADGKRLTRPDGIFKFAWPGRVTVRPELLEAAYVGKKSMQKFPFVGTHGFLAFKFRPGGVTDENGKTARGLVVSLNTYDVIPGRQNQNALDGLMGKFAVHYNINTAEGYVEANVFTDGNRISLYPLTLERERQVQLLRNAVEQATADRTGEMYSVVYNSCTNALVSFINGVLPDKEKIKDGWMPELVYRLRATIPDTAATMLRKRGLVRKPLPYLDETNYTRLFGE